ncbi:hypothetical protein B566_EDAN001176 [Ephemera danica]|nr:hypothetical protein B566_EDAN001176 [Ephemera danica]
MTDSDKLERLAAEELLCEAKRGSLRASLAGPSGWKKCPLPKTDTQFLGNTIIHTINSNNIKKRSKNVKKRIDSYKSGALQKSNTSGQDFFEKNNSSECTFCDKKGWKSITSQRNSSASPKIDKETMLPVLSPMLLVFSLSEKLKVFLIKVLSTSPGNKNH